MNFSQNPKKNQPPTEKFYRSSGLFMQLGLVLALFIVYISLEYSSTKNIVMIENDVLPDDIPFVLTAPPDIIIESELKPEPKMKKKVILAPPKIVPNDTEIIKILDLPTTDTNPPLDLGKIDEVVPEEDLSDEVIDFIILEEAPVFPGCEDLDKEKSKACFTKQMKKFVNKKFNAGIAEGLHLTGKQRIFAMFTIDKYGMVNDITISAPHKRLEKEALRVIQKLPEMIPGKQRKKAVAVKYKLPIVFNIE